MRIYKLATVLLVALTATTFISCHDDKEECEVLHPIATHLVGTWQHSTCLKQNDKGIWETIDMPGYIYTYTYNFTADGDIFTTRTTPEGWQQMQCGTWKAEEEKNGYTATYNGMSYFIPIYRLTASEYGYCLDTVNDEETREEIAGPFRLLYHRTPNTPLVEKVAGKWTLSKCYEKVNGEWHEATSAVPDEAWCDLNPTGLFTLCGKSGGQDRNMEGKWYFNVRTQQCRLEIDGKNFDYPFHLMDDNTMEIFFSENVDFVTGEVRKGEFKNVLVK